MGQFTVLTDQDGLLGNALCQNASRSVIPLPRPLLAGHPKASKMAHARNGG